MEDRASRGRGTPMDVRFDGQVALVTGSARGIGFATAELLVDSGATVAMVDVLTDRLAQSASTLAAKGTAVAYPQDLARVGELAGLVERIRADLGEIDVLVQPAAVGPQQYAQDITEQEWDEVFAVNTKGLFFLMREVVVQSSFLEAAVRWSTSPRSRGWSGCENRCARRTTARARAP